tara:strand:- start:5101 stop:5268 length:168 start_codon:yes stop_codon:yes gene_type:complete
MTATAPVLRRLTLRKIVPMLALNTTLMLAFSHVQGGEMKKQTLMTPEGITMKGAV